MGSAFNVNQLCKGLSELDQSLFARNQQSLLQEIGTFVDHFEGSGNLITTDELARSLVELTNCESKLKATKTSNLATTATDNIQEKFQHAQSALDELLLKIRQANPKDQPKPLEVEREHYLQEKEQRLKQVDKDIRREMDLLEERYAKKMRESIYQNLAGFQQP